MSKYQSYTAYASLWNKSFPSHWSVLPMYALAKEKSICGCVDLPLLSVYLDVGVIPFSAKAEKRTNVTSKDLSKYQRVDCGDFVLNNQQAWRGSVGISFDTGIVSPAYIVLSMLTDEVPENAYFATMAGTLADGLCEQIRNFVSEHPDTVLVAVDTFQIVRANNTDTSYANDYDDVRKMKQLADELKISILLVHHLRKQGDSDPLNKISGTTGISGAMDAIFVLDKSKRNADTATLVCTGRDIEYREMEMRLSKEDGVWTLVSDSLENPQMRLPNEMVSLTQFMKMQKSFNGTNSEFTELFNSYYGKKLSAKSLKQMMNRWRYSLEEYGVQFTNRRSNGQRLVDISYSSARDESAVSDVKILDGKSCVPSVPCAPVSERVALSAKTAESTRQQNETTKLGDRRQM